MIDRVTYALRYLFEYLKLVELVLKFIYGFSIKCHEWPLFAPLEARFESQMLTLADHVDMARQRRWMWTFSYWQVLVSITENGKSTVWYPKLYAWFISVPAIILQIMQNKIIKNQFPTN